MSDSTKPEQQPEVVPRAQVSEALQVAREIARALGQDDNWQTFLTPAIWLLLAQELAKS